MLSSNLGTSQPQSRPELPNEQNAPGAEAEEATSQLSQSQETQKLRLFTNVTEPLVIVLDDSRFGALNFGKYLILLPKSGSHLLQDCIVVTPRNWEKSGLPSFWTSTNSFDKRPIGWVGARTLVRANSLYLLPHPLAWSVASKYVDQKYRYAMSRVQRRNRIEFWMNRGWVGTELLIPVRLPSLRTPFQRLKSLAISKWSAFTGAT